MSKLRSAALGVGLIIGASASAQEHKPLDGFDCTLVDVNSTFSQDWDSSQGKASFLETGQETGRHNRYAAFMDSFYANFDDELASNDPQSVGELLTAIQTAYVDAYPENANALNSIDVTAFLEISSFSREANISLTPEQLAEVPIVENADVVSAFTPTQEILDGYDSGVNVSIRFQKPGFGYVISSIGEDLAKNQVGGMDAPIQTIAGSLDRYDNDAPFHRDGRDLRALTCE